MNCKNVFNVSGNICRRAFNKPKQFAALIGLPVKYVNNARTMLALISSKKAKINPEKFEEYGDTHLQDREKDHDKG